jgi:hypothetical protein
VVKEVKKKERSKGKYTCWKRRSRKIIKHQRRWILDNPESGIRHQRIPWSTSWKRWKDRLAKPRKHGSSGPRVLAPRVLDLGF